MRYEIEISGKSGEGGKVTIVSEEDYEYLKQFSWRLESSGYVVTFDKEKYKNTKKLGYLYMHRMINKTPNELFTDHINGNRLDNRRENLRTVTKSQNMLNKGTPRHNKSGYKGVYCHKQNNKWRASISIYGKQTHIGYFESKEDAARAYNEMALKYHGEYAFLNEVKE
jgi:hypothetical protein